MLHHLQQPFNFNYYLFNSTPVFPFCTVPFFITFPFLSVSTKGTVLFALLEEAFVTITILVFLYTVTLFHTIHKTTFIFCSVCHNQSSLTIELVVFSIRLRMNHRHSIYRFRDRHAGYLSIRRHRLHHLPK